LEKTGRLYHFYQCEIFFGCRFSVVVAEWMDAISTAESVAEGEKKIKIPDCLITILGASPEGPSKYELIVWLLDLKQKENHMELLHSHVVQKFNLTEPSYALYNLRKAVFYRLRIIPTD